MEGETSRETDHGAGTDTRIREVAVHVLEARIDGAFAYSQAWYTRRSAMLVEITTEDAGPNVRVGVHDRGSGIPEAFRGRIFGRFTQADSTATRQKGGTGLGLAICKRLVELMQGRIGFDDRPGGGTTFWFELPRHPA